jgi:hypothetical protein
MRRSRGKSREAGGVCRLPPLRRETKTSQGWGTRRLSVPTHSAKSAELMGTGIFGRPRQVRSGLIDSQVPKCEGPGAPAVVVTHPFREERGLDGERSVLVSHPSHRNRNVARWGTRSCRHPPIPQRTRNGWGTRGLLDPPFRDEAAQGWGTRTRLYSTPRSPSARDLGHPLFLGIGPEVREEG